MSNKNRWGVNILLGLGSSLFVLVALGLVGEWAVRYRERNRETVPGSYASLFYQHRRLRHALIRDHAYFGWVHINRLGFRGPQVSIHKPPGTLRIFTVGGSTTFDRGVSSDDRTWPARLEHWLTTSTSGRRVEVVNAGVPGYTVLDNTIRLQTELHRYRPDVIVLYHAHNDLFGALRPRRAADHEAARRPDEIDTQSPWTRWLSTHSLLYVKVQARLRALRPRRNTTQPVVTIAHELPARAAAGFERDLTSFLAIAQSLGIRVVLPAVAQVSGDAATETNPDIRRSWERSVPFATPEVVLAGYASFNEVIRRVADRFGATYVPTGGFGLTGPEWYEPEDPIHFNDAGAERMAKNLAAALVRTGLLSEYRHLSLAR